MAMDRERPRGRKRRKVCAFCVDKVEHIDYKDAAKLRRFHFRAVQDPAPPHHRHLRHASAPADRGHQACPSDRSAALRDRLIAVIPKTRRIPARLFYPGPGDAGAGTYPTGGSLGSRLWGAAPRRPRRLRAGEPDFLWRKSGEEHQGQAPGPHFYSRSFPLAGFWVGCL